MHRSIWVQVAHSSFIEGSLITENTAPGEVELKNKSNLAPCLLIKNNLPEKISKETFSIFLIIFMSGKCFLIKSYGTIKIETFVWFCGQMFDIFYLGAIHFFYYQHFLFPLVKKQRKHALIPSVMFYLSAFHIITYFFNIVLA